jgi:hypothetical protein
MDASNERSQFHSSTSHTKPRVSIVDQLRSQLQSKAEAKLLGESIGYSTPTKGEQFADEDDHEGSLDKSPQPASSVFHSISERVFNEAENMTMNQIWNKILNGTDNIATVMQRKKARDMLKSVQASEFTSIASNSFGGAKDRESQLADKNNQPEDMSAKFDFKK